ncbi:MAG TPA: chemotaxis protein CheR, partial [Alphaproteobacteria bacterium]|nr:chemotaxis protein CheR [Alphaproteobacteria bacterium]
CGFLRQRSGLILGQDKMYLIESRLLPVAKKTGLKSLEELVAVIRKGQDKKLIQAVTEAMTTNESFFFRDKTPFDTLREQVALRIGC